MYLPYLSFYVSANQSINLSIYLSIFVCIYLSTYLFPIRSSSSSTIPNHHFLLITIGRLICGGTWCTCICIYLYDVSPVSKFAGKLEPLFFSVLEKCIVWFLQSGITKHLQTSSLKQRFHGLSKRVRLTTYFVWIDHHDHGNNNNNNNNNKNNNDNNNKNHHHQNHHHNHHHHDHYRHGHCHGHRHPHRHPHSHVERVVQRNCFAYRYNRKRKPIQFSHQT